MITKTRSFKNLEIVDIYFPPKAQAMWVFEMKASFSVESGVTALSGTFSNRQPIVAVGGNHGQLVVCVMTDDSFRPIHLEPQRSTDHLHFQKTFNLRLEQSKLS